MLATIPLDLIENGQRLRDISEATVASLINSIADVGLLNPITVYRRPLHHGGSHIEGYGLIAGLHRKVACERLGLVEIEANILELDDLNRQIAECDENLCGSTLTPSERARFTVRRKDAYEALHPKTKHGGDKPSRQVGDFEKDNAAKRFTKDTAASTGQSERAVQRDAERGGIVAAALDLLKHTKLDTGSYLDQIKALPKAEQVKRVKHDLAKPKPKLSKSQIRAAQFAAIEAAWTKASPEVRREWAEHHGFTHHEIKEHADAEGLSA